MCFPAKGKWSAVPVGIIAALPVLRGGDNWFAAPARSEEVGGCTARWAVECRRAMPRSSDARYGNLVVGDALWLPKTQTRTYS